jgi:acyl-coenzyme A synthetase/AMP-(fatty) acid ligase
MSATRTDPPACGNVAKVFVVAAAGYEPSSQLAEEITSFVREHHSA